MNTVTLIDAVAWLIDWAPTAVQDELVFHFEQGIYPPTQRSVELANELLAALPATPTPEPAKEMSE